MPYFPFFIDISGRRCLIAGGGRIALHKINKLLPFSPEMHVVSPEICDDIAGIPGLCLQQREFRQSDLDGAFFVIAATDRQEVNADISRLCRERGILCNAVDSPVDCSFFFPALAQRGDITAGVSTSGKSPLIAAQLRRQIEGLLTPQLAEICDILGELRQEIRGKFLGHGYVVSAAAHGNCYVKSACAHCQHADTAACGGVAVGADKGLAGLAETLKMNLVADAVAGT